MSVFMRIPSEPTYIIVLDDEDDSEYNVPRWGNGVECDNTTCGKCGTRIGPYTTTQITAEVDMGVIYNRNIDQSLFKRRLVYHLVNPLAHALDRFSSITLYLMIPVVPFAIAVILDISGAV